MSFLFIFLCPFKVKVKDHPTNKVESLLHFYSGDGVERFHSCKVIKMQSCKVERLKSYTCKVAEAKKKVNNIQTKRQTKWHCQLLSCLLQLKTK